MGTGYSIPSNADTRSQAVTGWDRAACPLFPGARSTSVLRPSLLALAAVAAALAFCAAVILAGVFGAIHADFGGRLPADAAREGDTVTHNGLSYFALVFFFAGAAGRGGSWFCSSRQRCASRSTTAN